MQTVRLTLTTVTPLFLHGADNQGDAELRPPSIKGMMRFWWRTAAGRVEQDISRLRSWEGTMFGDSGDHGQCPFRITLARPENCPTPQEHPLPFVGQFRSSAYPGGQEIGTLTLQWHRHVPEEEQRQVVSALWLWVHLGGLGLRSRRGGGTLRAAWNGESSIRHWWSDDPTNSGALKTALETVLNPFPRGALPPTPPFPAFPILSADTARLIWVPCGRPTRPEAHDAIEGPYKSLFDSLKAGSKSADSIYLGSANPRSASPVHFRPIQNASQQWDVLLTIFYRRGWKGATFSDSKAKDILKKLEGQYTGTAEVSLP